MKLRLITTISFIAAVTLIFGFANISGALTELLPNLTPLPAHELRIQQIGKKKYLRFSTTSWNNGTGPLEIRGGATDRQTKRQKVYQRIYSDNGTSRDVLAGSFVWHKAHTHIHFDDYAVYTLQSISAPGASDRQSAKTTFCIIDTDHVSPGLENSPSSAQYTSCSMAMQGMSVGWGDTYRYYLDGQSIEITNLPNGEYNLKIEVDPKGRIVESDETDNTNNLHIQITGNTVTIP